jgi:hypothetical protein
MQDNQSVCPLPYILYKEIKKNQPKTIYPIKFLQKPMGDAIEKKIGKRGRDSSFASLEDKAPHIQTKTLKTE